MTDTLQNIRNGAPHASNRGASAPSSSINYNTINSFATRYLQTYYMDIDPDEHEIAKFLVREYKKIPRGSRMLDVGCGPTIHHLLPAVPYVSAIDVADYLDENLEQIRMWIARHVHAHQWDHFTKQILKLEGGKREAQDIELRENLLTGLIQKIMHCDVLEAHPIGHHGTYPVVGFFYCAEEVSTEKQVWMEIMSNVCRLVDPNQGRLFLSALRGTDFYSITKDDGTHDKLPTAHIMESDMYDALELLGFDMTDSVIEVVHTPAQAHQGINGVIMVSAVKKTEE